jgi:hypothetical protein
MPFLLSNTSHAGIQREREVSKLSVHRARLDLHWVASGHHELGFRGTTAEPLILKRPESRQLWRCGWLGAQHSHAESAAAASATSA